MFTVYGLVDPDPAIFATDNYATVEDSHAYDPFAG